jgi:hypothetical protein
MKKLSLFIFILLSLFISCKKADQENRFPLAEKHNIDEALLTVAFDEMKKVDGYLSLIVCRDGETVAEEYSYYKSYGPDSIKNIMQISHRYSYIS